MTDVETQKAVVHRSWDGPFPVVERGEGIYLYDTQGNRYIDGAAGSSVVVNIGHGVRSVVDAIYEQGKKVSYAATHVFTNEASLKLGQLVQERAPGSMRDNCRVWFSNTGTDSVEDAVRLARQYSVASGKPSKHVVISRWQSFHGNNIGLAGIGGHTARRRLYFPMFVNSPHIPPAYCYRCPFGDTYPACGLKCARALETTIRQTGEENVAAFIVEPMVGAALGSVPAPDDYLEIIREICDRYDVLLIADEVMTAWGRLGEWFGIERWGVTPDIIATAKGITSGYIPLGATIAKEEVWQAIEDTGVPFRAGHTLNQNPVACAAGAANIEYIEANGLLANAQEMGAHLLERLKELLEFDIVGDVRGMGLMCGMEFVRDKGTKEPFDVEVQVSQRFNRETLKRGLILYPCSGCVEGVAGDMIMVTPPLIITRKQVDEMIGIMKEALAATQAQLPG